MNPFATDVRRIDRMRFDQFAQQLNSIFERLARCVALLTCRLTIVPAAEAGARCSARLRASLPRGGRVRRRALDVINAATAIEHSLTVATRNLNHPEGFPGVKLCQGKESR